MSRSESNRRSRQTRRTSTPRSTRPTSRSRSTRKRQKNSNNSSSKDRAIYQWMTSRRKFVTPARLVPRGWNVPWLKIKSYADLVHVNSEFVVGRIKQTPYHYGPFEKENASLIDDLLILHCYGIVATSYQPALNMRKPAKSKGGEHLGLYYETRQRSFIIFFMPNRPEYMRAIMNYYDQPGLFAVSVADFRTTKFMSNFDDPIVVTEEREAQSAEAVRGKRFELKAEFPTDISFWEVRAFDHYPNIVKQLKSTVCVFIAYILPFGEGSITRTLINTLALLPIQPEYTVAI